MNLPNAIERLRNVIRRQHKSLSTEASYVCHEVLRQPLQNIDALRARRPARLRHAPTVAETQALLQTVRDRAGYPTNFIARLLYGCGLRVTEPLNLRIKDRRSWVVSSRDGNPRLAHYVSIPEPEPRPEFMRKQREIDALTQVTECLPRDRLGGRGGVTHYAELLITPIKAVVNGKNVSAPVFSSGLRAP